MITLTCSEADPCDSGQRQRTSHSRERSAGWSFFGVGQHGEQPFQKKISLLIFFILCKRHILLSQKYYSLYHWWSIACFIFFYVSRPTWNGQMRCRVCEWSQPQIQPQPGSSGEFSSQTKFFPFPSITNIEKFPSLECNLRFGSVLQIEILHCFLGIISRPRQEPRHHIL